MVFQLFKEAKSALQSKHPLSVLATLGKQLCILGEEMTREKVPPSEYFKQIEKKNDSLPKKIHIPKAKVKQEPPFVSFLNAPQMVRLMCGPLLTTEEVKAKLQVGEDVKFRETLFKKSIGKK